MHVVSDNNKITSINKSIASSHHNATPSLIALHASSGYKSVPMMFSIGKSKILLPKYPRYIGDVDDNLEDLM